MRSSTCAGAFRGRCARTSSPRWSSTPAARWWRFSATTTSIPTSPPRCSSSSRARRVNGAPARRRVRRRRRRRRRPAGGESLTRRGLARGASVEARDRRRAKSSSGDGSAHDLRRPVVFTQERRTSRSARPPRRCPCPEIRCPRTTRRFASTCTPSATSCASFPSGSSISPPRPSSRRSCTSCAARASSSVVLDLRGLPFVDSTGIRVILTETGSPAANGHEFSLIGGPPGRPARARGLRAARAPARRARLSARGARWRAARRLPSRAGGIP